MRSCCVSPSPLLCPPASAPLSPEWADICRSSTSGCTETAAGSQSSPGLLQTQPGFRFRCTPGTVLQRLLWSMNITQISVIFLLYSDSWMLYRWTCCTCPSHWLWVVHAPVFRSSPPAPGGFSAPHTAPPSPVAEPQRWPEGPHTAPPGRHGEKTKENFKFHVTAVKFHFNYRINTSWGDRDKLLSK